MFTKSFSFTNLQMHVLKATFISSLSFVCFKRNLYYHIILLLWFKNVNFSMQHPLQLFPLFQDSDSPRHSTASNSSTFSSPPSPSSPHKSKSLSLESTDRAGWETWWTRRSQTLCPVCPPQCSSPFIQLHNKPLPCNLHKWSPLRIIRGPL